MATFDCEHGDLSTQQDIDRNKLPRSEKITIGCSFVIAAAIGFFILGPLVTDNGHDLGKFLVRPPHASATVNPQSRASNPAMKWALERERNDMPSWRKAQLAEEAKATPSKMHQSGLNKNQDPGWKFKQTPGANVTASTNAGMGKGIPGWKKAQLEEEKKATPSKTNQYVGIGRAWSQEPSWKLKQPQTTDASASPSAEPAPAAENPSRASPPAMSAFAEPPESRAAPPMMKDQKSFFGGGAPKVESRRAWFGGSSTEGATWKREADRDPKRDAKAKAWAGGANLNSEPAWKQVQNTGKRPASSSFKAAPKKPASKAAPGKFQLPIKWR